MFRQICVSLIISGALGVTGATSMPNSVAATRAYAGTATTVFGIGPEIHLLPSFGPIGTSILVVGIGYRPGSHVRLLYGPPNAEFMQRPIARAVVTTNGTFRVHFRVSCSMTRFKPRAGGGCDPTGVGPQALVIGAFGGSSSGRAMLTSLIVTVA